MIKELQAFDENQTWDIFPLPIDNNDIPCKQVYKIKQKYDGFIERYKARLVTRGDSQVAGLDYFEIFSPVIKSTTIKCLLTAVVKNNWAVHQLDVNNTSLHGDPMRKYL